MGEMVLPCLWTSLVPSVPPRVRHLNSIRRVKLGEYLYGEAAKRGLSHVRVCVGGASAGKADGVFNARVITYKRPAPLHLLTCRCLHSRLRKSLIPLLVLFFVRAIADFLSPL